MALQACGSTCVPWKSYTYPIQVVRHRSPNKYNLVSHFPFASWRYGSMDSPITTEKQSDDASSIIEYPGNDSTGRAYRNQAMALIGICRFFSRYSVQGQVQDTELRT